MEDNPYPKLGDIVRARISGKVIDVEYRHPCRTGYKQHWVILPDGFRYYLLKGKDRFVYPIEQMENYKRKNHE